ncbi:glycosyltransferase [Flagellimonas sp.]|uniref:glycosyltransferase n=1 Tax=Flagellimonas sp. TaxID=2058762 RepID=UPI003BAE9E24
MKQLKVVHITETLATGVLTYLKDLSSVIAKDKDVHNIIIYSGLRKGTDITSIPKSTTLVELNMAKEIHPVQDSKSFIALYKELKRLDPDVIHAHSSKAGILGRLVSTLLGAKIKVFYTAHGFAFLRKDISVVKRRFFYGVEKLVSFLSRSTIVACGDTELEYAKKLGNAILVRNGVDLSKLSDYYSPNSNGVVTIGILSRLTFARNPKFFNEIALTFPEVNFLWIGDGELRHLITAPNVKVTGWFTDKKEGYAHLNKVDIYLQTSLWEGLPIAVLEAMAFSKPVVASNVIGNKDAVAHTETGYLYNNFEEARIYIARLINNEELRQRLGANGLKRCSQYFEIQKNFSELVSVYRTT